MSPQHRTIAHYQIVSKLGEGGMGEVWLATDTKLGRDVAIKVLPQTFSHDADRMARFTREAQMLASLNHPNIATIHGVEDRALVMELVHGPTLAERIAQGPVPLDEALPIARQIAEALEYAHEHGIIHRDLKPANVKITPEGRVKVLDFGLAKAMDTGATSPANPADSPTLTLRATQFGVIVGTAAYMSPEQARGKPVDKRADIWSFGVVLFEMLTGCQPFSSEDTVSDILAAVITRTPDWTLLPAGTPGALRRIIERCLDKDVKHRLRDIGEARIVLEQPMRQQPETNVPQPPARSSKAPWLISAAATLGVALLALMYRQTEPPPPAPTMRFDVDLGPNASLAPSSFIGGAAAILSPDGSRLVYVGKARDGGAQLFTRTLDEAQATAIPETQNANSPFFSPDGQWVGFFAEFKLKKVRVTGGTALTLSEAPSQRGGSWGEDGIIATLNAGVGLSRIPSDGGAPQPVTTLSKESREITHRWPQVLGSQAVLFTSHVSRVNFDEAVIEVLSLKDGARKTLKRGGYYGRYVPALPGVSGKGFLLYLRQSTLFAAPMDADRLELTGPAVPIVEGVTGNPDIGGAQFDVSSSGVMVFQSGKPSSQRRVLEWLDSAGNGNPLTTLGRYSFPRISPDGSQIALNLMEGAHNDVWLYDWRRDRLSRLTFQLSNSPTPTGWFPDGKHIVVSSDKLGGPGNIYWMRADGSGGMVKLIESANQQVPWSFSPDGKRLAYIDFHPDTGLDLWTAPLDTSDPDRARAGQPEPFERSAAMESYPSFSPDGRWLAYMSTESGNEAIYVRSFPGPGGKWQISPSGTMPVWSPNGRELFYRTVEDRRIMVVPYRSNGDAFVAEKARLWSDKQLAVTGVLQGYDVAPDGKRIAALLSPDGGGEQAPLNHLTFIVNFVDELRGKIVAGRTAP